MVKEDSIKSHWEAIPVGENVIGSLDRDFAGDHDSFFNAFDAWRYSKERHILGVLDQFRWHGKRVLEIGLGQGADSEQLIRRGAIWSGIDLTQESVQRVAKRLALRNLPHEQLVQGSVVQLPFPDNRFEMIYSHGVLHHVPDIIAAQRELLRVLKPDGRLIIMLYARNSLNYQISIKVLRRLGLALIYFLPVPVAGIYAEHKRLAQKAGIIEYLKMSNFIHRSTDGPDNPYSKVYTRRLIEQDFPSFDVVRTFKMYMHAPPLPVHGLPGSSLLGWHLWAVLSPRA